VEVVDVDVDVNELDRLPPAAADGLVSEIGRSAS
jgi:hypothetical protein